MPSLSTANGASEKTGPLSRTRSLPRQRTWLYLRRIRLRPGLSRPAADARGLEKCFGLAAWPGIIVMHLIAFGCLVFTYKLVRLRFPQWLAVIVTFTVGINGWFVELTDELLTDIPFVLCLLALYGWERLASRFTISRPTALRRRGDSSARSAISSLGSLWRRSCGPRFSSSRWPGDSSACEASSAAPTDDSTSSAGGFSHRLARRDAVRSARPRIQAPFRRIWQATINSLRQAAQNIRKNLPVLTGTEMNFSFFGQKWWPDGFVVRGHYIPGMTDIMSVLVILRRCSCGESIHYGRFSSFSPSPSHW